MAKLSDLPAEYIAIGNAVFLNPAPGEKLDDRRHFQRLVEYVIGPYCFFDKLYLTSMEIMLKFDGEEKSKTRSWLLGAKENGIAIDATREFPDIGDPQKLLSFDGSPDFQRRRNWLDRYARFVNSLEKKLGYGFDLNKADNLSGLKAISQEHGKEAADHLLTKLWNVRGAIFTWIEQMNLEAKGIATCDTFSFDYLARMHEQVPDTETCQFISICFDKIPMPIIDFNELRDLKKDRVFRKSIRAFRDWSKEIISCSRSIAEINGEVTDAIEDYRSLLKNERVKAVTSTVELVVSTIAGFVGDYLKSDAPGATGRLVKVADRFIDKCQRIRQSQENPLYFVHKISSLEA